MTEDQRLEFFKDFIKEKLQGLKEDIPARRYRLLLAVIDDCDDYNELREMAELDMQIDLFEYTKTEISPKMAQLNMEMAEIRESQSTYVVQDKPITTSGPVEYTTEDMLEDMDDPEIDAAMAAILAARLQTEPLEETYRDELIDGVNDTEPSLDDIDNLGDEMDGFGDIGDATSLSDDDFGELSDLDGFEDEESEDLHTKHKEESKNPNTIDNMMEDDPFSDFDNDSRQTADKKETGDDFFEDEEDEQENGSQNIDDIDMGDIGELGDEEDNTEFIEDGDFEQAFGDMLSENPLFEDNQGIDPEDLELSAMLDLDAKDDESDETFDNIDFDSDILGDSDDSNFEDSSDGLDGLDSLDMGDDFNDSDDSDSDGLDSLDMSEDFDEDFGDESGDSDESDGIGQDNDMEFDPADFGDFPDADNLFGGESSVDNKPIIPDDSEDLDDSLLSAFGEDSDEDSDDSSDGNDPFASLDNSSDDDFGDFGEIQDEDPNDSEDGLDSIADDLFGVEDDSDDFFSSQENSKQQSQTSRQTTGQSGRQPQQKAPERKVQASTIFSNGTKQGDETQKMFNAILKVGSMFGRAQSSASKQVKKGIQAGSRSLQNSGLFSLSSNG